MPARGLLTGGEKGVFRGPSAQSEGRGGCPHPEVLDGKVLTHDAAGHGACDATVVLLPAGKQLRQLCPERPATDSLNLEFIPLVVRLSSQDGFPVLQLPFMWDASSMASSSLGALECLTLMSLVQ